MGTTIREARYIFTNVEGNNNKFWNIQQLSDNSCIVEWGRVGSTGQNQTKTFLSQLRASDFFESKCSQKERKGYQRLKVLKGSGVLITPVVNTDAAAIATKQIETDSPQTLELVKRLVKANVHNILSSTELVYDTSRGIFSTPLGIITQDAIDEARLILRKMAKYIRRRDFHASSYIDLLDSYLRLVPQRVAWKMDPEFLYPDLKAIRKQNEILDSLQSSLTLVVDKPDDATGAQELKMFEAKLSLVEDQSLIDRIIAIYQSTRQRNHVSHKLNVNLVYEVEIKSMKELFKSYGRQLGNIMELWHGTRVSNLLSILKSGFVIPPSNAPHCTGRMFGNGVYFSDQSTKCLNYSFGYWGGAQDKNCFMLLNDVAMGKYYVPKSSSTIFPRKGYNSTFAKPNRSGVFNNEMVVYDTRQINPKYLVEFSSDTDG